MIGLCLIKRLDRLCVRLHHKICLHNEEVNPGGLLLSSKPDRLGSFFVSSSLLDNSGFEEEDDGRESKWHDLHDESSGSFCFSPVTVQQKEYTKGFEVRRCLYCR